MLDEKEIIKLVKKNRKLKTKIWEDYRSYSDELRMLRHQNKSLQNSINIEKNKNRELIQHYSNIISKLKEEFHQINQYLPSPSQNRSASKIKKNKDDFKWRFQELEEEGKNLQLETEKTFKKCRENSSANFWLKDNLPVSNYVFDYPPIIISPPPIVNKRDEFFMNEDRLSSSSSSSSIDNDIQISPIISSPKRHKRKGISKKQNENVSSNSSTVSVQDENNDSDSKDSSDTNEQFELQKVGQNNYNKKSEQNNKLDNQSTESSDDPIEVIQTSPINPYRPPNIQIPENNSKPENKNPQIQSPIHIKTNIENDEKQNNQNEPLNQVHIQPSPKKQSNAQIIKPKVTNPNLAMAGFMSQSGWDDDIDNEEVVFDQDEIDENDKENHNKSMKSYLSAGTHSETNPILDTSDQLQKDDKVDQKNDKVDQKPEIKEKNSQSENKRHSKSSISLPDSTNFDFVIDIKDDDFNIDNDDNNLW